jgi:copper chaperone CopZ
MTSQHSNWNDFNDAGQQAGFDLIPKGTLAKVRMTIKPGGFDDPARGWTGGWATESDQTGSVYLNAEFVVLDGPFIKRKLWSTIGLHSAKSDEWANMGRAFIRAALNSARGIQSSDISPQAQAARRIQHFGELDGLVFVGRVDVEKDSRGDDKNVIKQAIEPDHKDYAQLMAGGAPSASSPSGSVSHSHAAAPVAQPNYAKPAASGITKPSWAQ